MITGKENLLHIAQLSQSLIPVFEKQGLGNYFKEENLTKIGRFTRLETMLKSNNIDVDSFVESLNILLKEERKVSKTSMDQQENLHFAAMLPCGLRNPFKEFTESFIEENEKLDLDFNYLIEGNVNHELSYYPLLDNIKDESELPDIVMASDVNNFFHRPFVERFVDKGVFETYTPYSPNEYLQKANYADPQNHYTMFTANMLIMVVDKQKLGDRKMPEKWEDLLAPCFANDIIMRGEDDFFCNAVLLPFYKEWGMPAIKTLATNIKSGKHPAEMVKLAGKGSDEGAAIYIMPYFFSKRIKSDKVAVVWPEDGAIASPVFLLVKKDKVQKNKVLLDFLLGETMGKMLQNRYFPSIHPDLNNDALPTAVSWLGWDFLRQHDIGQLKSDIRDEFMKIWTKKEAL